jgi:hypothetical protein
MEIAAGVFALRPAPRRPRCLRGRTRRPTSSQGCPSFRLLFEAELAAAGPNRKIGCDHKKFLISRRFGRAGSPGAARPPAPGSPGTSRSEPSTLTPTLLRTGLGGGTRCGWIGVSLHRAGSGPGDSRAEPLLRGRLLEKGRKLEPKPPSGQSACVRTGIGKKPKTCRWSLRAIAPRQFPLHPDSSRFLS